MAARFFVNGGVDNNWNSTSNWSTTSGGSGGSAVPTSSDDVTLDTNSPNCVINVAAVAKSITCTNFAHTLTFNNTLTLSPATSTTPLILGASMTFAGSSALIINGPSGGSLSLTSNGKTFGVPLQLNSVSNAITYTLNDNWTTSSDVSCQAGTTLNITVNGNTLTVGGSLTFPNGAAHLGGTTTFVMGGTGTISGTGTLQVNLTINTASTITFSGKVQYGVSSGVTLTYTAGTVVTSGSTLSLVNVCTLNTNGITWDNVSFLLVTNTATLTSDLHLTGTLSLGTATNSETINGQSIFAGGDVIVNTNNVGGINGTTTLVLNGTGTVTSGSTGPLRLNTTINTSGTVTFSGTFYFLSSTLTYIAGTLNASGCTLNIPGITSSKVVTLDLGGTTWGGLVANNGNVTTITLKSEIKLTTTLTLNGTSTTDLTIVSDVGGTQRKLTCQSGISEDVIHCSPTDIDSSSGVPVYYAKGTLTNTTNWVSTNPGVAKSGGQVVFGGTTYNSQGGYTGGVFGG